MLKAGMKGLWTAFLKLCSEEQILRDVEELMETAKQPFLKAVLICQVFSYLLAEPDLLQPLPFYSRHPPLHSDLPPHHLWHWVTAVLHRF